MASFIDAHVYIAESEGGFQQMTNDTGNYVDGVLVGTNYGISADTLKSFLGRTPTMEDMKNLTYQEAVSIYIDMYWNRIVGNEIKNQSVALLIYDGSVNQGKGAMRGIVGQSMRELGSYIDNSEVFTSEGTSQLNSLNQEKLFLKIYNGRKLRYERGQEAFVQGHLNRLSGIKFFKNKPSFNLAIIFVVLIVILSVLIYRL